AMCVRRPEAAHQLQCAKRRDRVAPVRGPAQHREQVLDVRRLEELQATVLDERNVAAHEFDLERGTVMRTAKEHRLALKQYAFLAVAKDRVDDMVGLRALIEHGHEPRVRAGTAMRNERLRVPARRLS